MSPEVDLTSNTPSSITRTVTSNVPPPKSNINIFYSFFDLSWNPYAMAAAVGSLIIRNTSKPAIIPESFVAYLYASLK